jgi:hypothetical protein
MKIERHPIIDGVIDLAVTGEVDMATADELYDDMTAAVAHAADIVVDLAEWRAVIRPASVRSCAPATTVPALGPVCRSSNRAAWSIGPST